MQPLKKPDNRLFLGLGGSGKSHLMRHQLGGEKRWILFDVAGGGEDANRSLGTVIEDPRHLIERVQLPGDLRIVWRGFGEMGDEAFEFANQAAWHATGITVVWEELDGFTTAGRLPYWAHRLAHEGRHRRCKAWAISRSAHIIPRDLTRNITRIMVGQTSEPRDLKWLSEKIGDPQAVNGIREIREHHFLDWQGGKSGIKKSPFR